MDAHKPQTPVLDIQGLAISYETRRGDVPAVRDVSLQIRRGEAFSIVGESGCGKSTVAFGIVNFLGRNGRIVDGRILFQGQDLVGQSPEELRRIRGDRIAMVYQDPMAALNPSMRIGDQMAEVLIVHRHMKAKEAEDACIEMLKRVHMPDPANVVRRYPHQLSGGQQQRVVIGMALLNDPALLIMDEPTTALDVTVEAAVLDLVSELQHEFQTAIMYISHNLGVVARVSDRVAVMYAGEIVERASVQELFARPQHPYTQGLLRCVPRLGTDKRDSVLYPIRGRVPSPGALPPGCIFEPRCDYAREDCRFRKPELRELYTDHLARCHFAEEIRESVWQPPEDLLAHVAMPPDGMAEPILRVQNARTFYQAPSRKLLSREKLLVKAVDDVSIEIKKGHTLGIVGESGCGKCTLGRVIIHLLDSTDGQIFFEGKDITRANTRQLRKLRENMKIIFQDPYSSLDPRMSVLDIIGEPLTIGGARRSDVIDRVQELMTLVGLDPRYLKRYPHAFSGGQRQRIGVARAVAMGPSFVVADEPVSSLDVSIQAQVLNLLEELQDEYHLTYLFISHDLSVVRHISDRMAVMYLGQIVEHGPTDALYEAPLHPYTQALLAAIPQVERVNRRERILLTGGVPSPIDPPSGCRFHPRCFAKVGRICEEEQPPAFAAGDQQVACWIYGSGARPSGSGSA